MELTNEFTVDVPMEQAWGVLTDLERIAPCMPGAQLQSVDGDDYLGIVRVKVGPVTAEYRGKAHFLERDAAAHKAVLRAEGRETRGQGNASATITAQLEPSGDATRVSVVTDLSISGRVAQFGRGVLADVSNKLLGQFVQQLESTVLAEKAGGAGPAPRPPSAPAAGAAATATPGAAVPEGGHEAPERAGAGSVGNAAEGEPPVAEGQRPAAPSSPPSAGYEPAEPAPVNLVRVVGPVILKRVLPPVAILVLFLLWRRRRRRAR